MTAGQVFLAAVAAAPVWALAGLMVLAGPAGPLVTAVLLNSVPDHQPGTVSGVFHTSRQFDGALAVAVFGALLARPGSFLSGLPVSVLIAAGVALTAAAASLLLRSPEQQVQTAGQETTTREGIAA